MVLGSVALGFFIGGNNKSGSNAETQAFTESSVIDGGIAIPGFEKLVMKAGQTDQVASFYNPEANECFFRISVLLADGTELFRSGMIKPGQKIEELEISQSLKAGTYKDAVLRYDCYAMESLQPMNGAETILNLEVLP